MKKTYFASDFHLGIDTTHSSKEREKHIVQWLDEMANNAKELYLLGDIFDYWYEYNEVVPKGFVLILGKLAELVNKGISITWFTGNHDMWTFGYIEKELGVKILKRPKVITINGKSCYLAHGDGLSKGEIRYAITKWVLSNPLCQFLFSIIPSRIGLGLMKKSSSTSRINQSKNERKELQMDQKLMDHCENILKLEKEISYFIMGHRHRPRINTLSNGSSKYVNLGDWTHNFTYGVLDENGNFELKKYPIPS